MAKIKQLESEIKGLLERYPQLRESNEKLYGAYLWKHGIGDDSVVAFFSNFLSYKVSTFASVTRTRRKLVEKYPELGPSTEKREEWKERQYEMSDYAKGREYIG